MSAEAVLATTRAMLQAAASHDWQRLSGLEEVRRHQLAACAIDEDCRALLEATRQLNDLLLETVTATRDTMGEELRTINRGRRAVGAYRAAGQP